MKKNLLDDFIDGLKRQYPDLGNPAWWSKEPVVVEVWNSAVNFRINLKRYQAYVKERERDTKVTESNADAKD